MFRKVLLIVQALNKHSVHFGVFILFRPSFKVLDDWLQALVMKGEFPSYPEPPLLTAMIRQVFEEHQLPLDADNMYYVPLNDVDVKRIDVLNESYC